ncbi:MAG: hypothetical protein V1790_00030 [Planctomycetota bacterium]
MVLVLFFIVLATALAVLLTANSARIVRTTRNEHESMLLRQLTDSARAWVQVHGGPHADTPVTLDGKDIGPEGSSGEVRINVDGQSPNVIVIRAQLTFTGRQVVRTTRWAAPPLKGVISP